MNRSRCHSFSASRLFASAIVLAVLLTEGPRVFAQTPVRIVFLHHSTGYNLIEQGGVRAELSALGYEFYDHGYNGEGLRLADGSSTGTDFDVPGDNTDPDGLAAIFSQPLHDPPDNSFSYLMQYDVIIVKSCFPTSNIADDQQLADDQSYYLAIRDRMSEFPGKLLIIVTQPPQVPANTNPEEGQRARTLATWLAGGDFLAGHPNVRTFDFFDRLAGDDNFLRPEYRPDDEYDAHPNELANRTIGPEFVRFIDEAIRSDAALETGSQPAGEAGTEGEVSQQDNAPTEDDSPAVASVLSGLVEGFETGTEQWGSFTDREESSVACESDTGLFHGGASALRIEYQIAPGGWGGCSRGVEQQDWSGADGVTLWFRSDAASKPVTLIIYSGTPDKSGPYEVSFETTQASIDDWAERSFVWSDFIRPDWADPAFPADIDPRHITGLDFTFVAEEANAGTLWVDDISLMELEAPGDIEPEEVSAPGDEAPPVRQTCPLSILLLSATVIAGLYQRRRKGSSAL